MTVADIMIRDVISIEPDARLFDAVLVMNANHIRHLPVVDCGRLVGILTSRDIRFLASNISESDQEKGLYNLSLKDCVVDVMAKEPIVTHPEVELGEALDLFLDEKVGAIPVVDDQDRLVGIVGYIDFLKILRDHLS